MLDKLRKFFTRTVRDEDVEEPSFIPDPKRIYRLRDNGDNYIHGLGTPVVIVDAITEKYPNSEHSYVSQYVVRLPADKDGHEVHMTVEPSEIDLYDEL